MGFTGGRRTFRLEFEGDYDGLTVRARSVPIGAFSELAGLAELKSRQFTPEDMQKIQRVFEIFAEALVEWNVEDEFTGEAVPADLTGILAQDMDFMLHIILTWMEKTVGVSGPLAQRSSGGEPSAELLTLPTEVLSASPGS